MKSKKSNNPRKEFDKLKNGDLFKYTFIPEPEWFFIAIKLKKNLIFRLHHSKGNESLYIETEGYFKDHENHKIEKLHNKKGKAF